MTTTPSTYESNAQRLQALENDVWAARAKHGRGSSQGLAAFQRLCQEHARITGRPIDELDQSSPVEEERFFALTAQGPDGHVYWLGARWFKRNDGATRLPGRWWWEHRHQIVLEQNAIIRPVCGEARCINPEHAAKAERHERAWSNQAMLAALQVEALRLGHAPTKTKWAGPPSTRLYELRFGSWSQAVAAAGLEPAVPAAAFSAAQCIEALREARRILGWWPTFDEFRLDPRVKATLERRGLPRRSATICLRLGCRWPEALRRAGKRGRA